MFGTESSVRTRVFEGDLKEACQVARDLKSEVGNQFKIFFVEYNKDQTLPF
jgi:hypothetical protein